MKKARQKLHLGLDQIPILDGERRRAFGEKTRDFLRKNQAYDKSLYRHAKKFAALPEHLRRKYPELVLFENRRRLQNLFDSVFKKPARQKKSPPPEEKGGRKALPQGKKGEKSID